MKPSIKQVKRTSRARARWQSHITAQQISGLTQAAYCREHHLNDKSFSHWKRKLRDEATPEAPVLIPISVTSTPLAHQSTVHSGSDKPYLVKATLPNGITVEIALPSTAALLPMLSQLVQLPC